MFKNLKMKTALTSAITVLTIICITILYIFTQTGMTKLMKKSAQDSMKTSLNSQTTLISEYVSHQEDLLKKFSISPMIIDYLKTLITKTNSLKHSNLLKIILKDLTTGKVSTQANGILM